MSTLKQQYKDTIKDSLKKEFDYPNVMQVPQLEKIVINRGLGEAVTNSKALEVSLEILRDISGQKPVVCTAKKSISNFKIREGQAIGCKVTLRGDKMYDFFTKLVKVVLPKIRDFRGLPNRSFDGRGNYTFGIKEDSIFPEVKVEKIDRQRGFDITIVTSAGTDDEARHLLKSFGFPFRKSG